MKILRAVNAPSLTALLLCVVSAGSAYAAETLESLDDPAPAGEALESLDGSPAPAIPPGGKTGGDEVALDLGAAAGADFFNPYAFSRNGAWGFLPLVALMLVGIHLIRVPKRKSKRKIDQAKRFFRGISGDGTRSSIMTTGKSPDTGDRRGKP